MGETKEMFTAPTQDTWAPVLTFCSRPSSFFSLFSWPKQVKQQKPSLSGKGLIKTENLEVVQIWWGVWRPAQHGRSRARRNVVSPMSRYELTKTLRHIEMKKPDREPGATEQQGKHKQDLAVGLFWGFLMPLRKTCYLERRKRFKACRRPQRVVKEAGHVYYIVRDAPHDHRYPACWQTENPGPNSSSNIQNEGQSNCRPEVGKWKAQELGFIVS